MRLVFVIQMQLNQRKQLKRIRNT